MIIAFGTDHGGFPLKKSVIAAIESCGGKVIDLGTFDETPVDYPDYAKYVAHAIRTRCGCLYRREQDNRHPGLPLS